MTPRAAAPLGVLLLAGLTVLPAARGQELRMVESRPVAADTIADGAGREIWVRFNAPVDHAASRLMILSDGGEVVRRLNPRLDAAPDVLYAETGGLTPGYYTLRWETRPRPGGEVATGTLDFTVR